MLLTEVDPVAALFNFKDSWITKSS